MSAYPEVRRSRRGRPPCCPPDVVSRVVGMRLAGLSLGQISLRLNGDGVPTPAGRPRWTKSHVDRLLNSRHGQQTMAAMNALGRTV
jgi:Recombinase